MPICRDYLYSIRLKRPRQAVTSLGFAGADSRPYARRGRAICHSQERPRSLSWPLTPWPGNGAAPCGCRYLRRPHRALKERDGRLGQTLRFKWRTVKSGGRGGRCLLGDEERDVTPSGCNTFALRPGPRATSPLRPSPRGARSQGRGFATARVRATLGSSDARWARSGCRGRSSRRRAARTRRGGRFVLNGY
jgi:hypothetical protein